VCHFSEVRIMTSTIPEAQGLGALWLAQQHVARLAEVLELLELRARDDLRAGRPPRVHLVELAATLEAVAADVRSLAESER
jgi:hypothetical protein